MNKYLHKLVSLIQDRQFQLYTAIGLSGVTLDFLIFALLISKTDINYLLANFIAISIAILNNFLLNAYFNFKKTDGLLYRFASFYFVGLMGIILSQILLTVFIAVGFTEIVAKILTLPPILVFQFILNKKYSFKSGVTRNSRLNIVKILRRHYLIVLLNIIFILISLFFIKSIPLTSPLGGPDENAHYSFNVEYLIKNKKLPISGQDDVGAISNCRDNPSALVPCLYSYQIYPAFNYVVYAVSGWSLHEVFNVSYVKGARLASLIWGVIYINVIYLALMRITKNRKLSTIVTALVSLVPQVVFIFSYINQDAHSLAISAILLYTLIRYFQDKDTTSLILMSIAIGGLLPIAKYNYFVYVPFLIFFFAYAYTNKLVRIRQIKIIALGILLSFISIASYWYARNYVLYNDLFGQNYLLKKMSEHSVLGTPHPFFNIDTLVNFTNINFFEILFQSFFMAYGYMQVFADQSVYTIISAVLVAALYLSILLSYKSSKKYRYKSYLIIVALLAFIIANVAFVYFNSAKYDFQPQGRYLFPVLAPLSMALAFLYKYNSKQKYVIHVLFYLLIFINISSINLLVRYYL